MNVDIRPAAQKDIRSAAGNLVKGTLTRALGFFVAIERTLKKLAANPGLGAPCEFEAPGLTGLRVWPVSRQELPDLLSHDQ